MSQYHERMRGHQEKIRGESPRQASSLASSPLPPSPVPVSVEFKKHVSLVHCSGDLTLLERKTFNVLLLNAYDNLLRHTDHTIGVAALSAFIGYNSKDTSTIKKVLIGLMSKVIVYDLLDDLKRKEAKTKRSGSRQAASRGSRGDNQVEKNEAWEASPLLSYARMRNGTITYRFDPGQAIRFYNPDTYSRINVAIQRNFGSNYAIALHENCLRFRNTHSTGWWSLDEVRLLLGATAPTYDDFRRLNNKVLKPAIEEVNRFSEITIEVEAGRPRPEELGRVPPPEHGQDEEQPRKRFTHVKFHIQENPQRTLFDPSEEAHRAMRSKEAYKRLIALGIADRLALTTVAQDETFAASIADYVEARVKIGKVSNPAGYTAYLISNKVSLDEPEILKKKRTDEAKLRADELTKRKAEARDAQRRREFLKFETLRRERIYAEMSPDKLSTLFTEFVENEGVSHRLGPSPDRTSLALGALQAFQRFVVRRTVGMATEADFDRYQRDGQIMPLHF